MHVLKKTLLDNDIETALYNNLETVVTISRTEIEPTLTNFDVTYEVIVGPEVGDEDSVYFVHQLHVQ